MFVPIDEFSVFTVSLIYIDFVPVCCLYAHVRRIRKIWAQTVRLLKVLSRYFRYIFLVYFYFFLNLVVQRRKLLVCYVSETKYNKSSEKLKFFFSASLTSLFFGTHFYILYLTSDIFHKFMKLDETILLYETLNFFMYKVWISFLYTHLFNVKLI